jgi:hypothetical protein
LRGCRGDRLGDAGVDATISYTEVGPAPFTLADLLKALEIAVGTSPATSDDITRLNVEAANAGLDISDAARLARKVVGLEANP